MSNPFSDPALQGLMAQLMSDPEFMTLLQRPGVFEKLQTIMQNPSDPSVLQRFAADPDFAAIMGKLGALQGAGGFGGLGGMGSGLGMGGFGGQSARPAANPGHSASVTEITSADQFYSIINSSGARVVVADFTAVWCGPCKMISPVFHSLADSHHSKLTFLKVDGDRNRPLVQQLGINGFPTFHFYQHGKKIEEFSGADQGRLTSLVEQYAFAEPEKKHRECPYRHFPLKESEMVKYADIKYEPVEAKLKEYDIALRSAGDVTALSEAESKAVDSIISKLKDKGNWQNQNFTADQVEAMRKLLLWPASNHGPVLNLWRIFVLHPSAAAAISKRIDDFLGPIMNAISKAEKPVNAMLAIRVLCNSFNRRALCKAIGAKSEEVADTLNAVLATANDANLLMSVLCLFINFAILFREDSAAYEGGKIQLLSAVAEALRLVNASNKLKYTALVVIGTLIYEDQTVKEMAGGLEIDELAKKVKAAPAAAGATQEDNADEKQMKEAAVEVLKCLEEKPE